MKKQNLVAVEILHHIIPEGRETIEQLEDRARKSGYSHFVRETGGLLLNFHQYRFNEPEKQICKSEK